MIKINNIKIASPLLAIPINEREQQIARIIEKALLKKSIISDITIE